MMDVIDIRMIRGKASNGEEYYWVTSLPQEEYTSQQVKELYKQRWSIETSFRYDKYDQKVENFSAKKTEGILQEWRAAMLCNNIAQLLIAQAQKQLDEEQAQKTNKYYYKINRRIAIGIVKEKLHYLINGQILQEEFELRIINNILKYREPLRLDRSFRRKQKYRTKFNQIYQ